MNHLNSILIEGIIVRDPEVKAVSRNGDGFVVFAICSHRYFRRPEDESGQWQDEELFIDVLAWGELGARCIELIGKGMTVRVAGRLKVSSYKSKDGTKDFSKPAVLAQTVEFRRKKVASDGTQQTEEEDISLNNEGGKDAQAISEPVVIYEY